jgi:superfamily I DNA/RNA helicase
MAVLNAVDFGDLLSSRSSCSPTIPISWPTITGRFRFLLVDEYQDTNVAQYLWLRLLAQGTGDRNPTSAASAMTTSRSMAGAAPRWTTSCASSATFPAHRHPAGAQLPLHLAILGHASASDRPQ